MEQQGLLQRGHNVKLDMAALAVTEVLSRNGVKHGFFGGYAVSVFGGERLTQDVDVIVGEDAQAARQQLLAGNGNFYMTATKKLKFRLEGQDIDIEVELLRGGKDQPMKLPDINSAPIILLNPHEVGHDRVNHQMPLLHPGVLVLTKLKRWMHISNSTRPASIARAVNDMQDIKTILEWLIRHGLKINFDMYPEKNKEELLPGMKSLLETSDPDIAGLLKDALFPDDFAAIA
ncbi:hypothetical protein MGYG_04869 [Nannizzia gypsea CBS 118893]|uniref:Nucleotidyl transferase AbiEii/AbiGii toxin family protein n=1 Tax=Arthroderma gypseum (strain ATCC MYA-4604 / CBS 118893) TaxID=535722 RepID=E4UXC3_ARTGP|nr:hypothetical protein MGYG_04869 [Nannizzia gypsea CBS 118893]EFR01871.1 hypothetical protein MGYG_04869 [Nannizzia gypsea CBS 118893]